MGEAKFIARVSVLAVALGQELLWRVRRGWRSPSRPIPVRLLVVGFVVIGFGFVIGFRGKYVIDGFYAVNKFVGLRGRLVFRCGIWDCAEFG